MIEKYKKEYKEKCGELWYDEEGEPRIEYVNWLEQRLETGQVDAIVNRLPDFDGICKHFSVDKDYVPDGAPYEPETAIKNKYRREGALWLLELIKEKAC